MEEITLIAESVLKTEIKQEISEENVEKLEPLEREEPITVKREIKTEDDGEEELEPPAAVFVDPSEVAKQEAAEEIEDPLAICSEGLSVKSEATKEVFLFPGLGMVNSRDSYSASQGEHTIAHAMAVVTKDYSSLRGEKKAVTTITVANLQEEMLSIQNPIIKPKNYFGSKGAMEIKRGCIKLDSDEEWDKFFDLRNDPSTNTTNKELFSPKKGESHYHGKEIVGKIADQIKAEISEGMRNHTIVSIMLKEGKREGNIVYPTVRVVLRANKDGVDIAKLLGGSICKEYGVKTITFCHPNQENTRGACCYNNSGSDNEERVYEIISGLYEMTLKWYAGGRECKIKVNIDGKNGVTLLDGNGVTAEQLRANKEVKIGKRREPKSLYEALAPQLQQKSSESVDVLQQPTTGMEDAPTPTSTSQDVFLTK